MRCIVSTAPEGRVIVTWPTQDAMTFLTHGGAPDGYFGRTLDRDWEIQKFVNAGLRESIAVGWIDAIMNGGKTDAEAYGLIRDKDTKDEWTGKELWDRSDLPPDRWFRDAWCRSHNGGPLSIHLGRAKAIQFRKIKDAVAEENRKLEENFECSPIDIDVPIIRDRIVKARDEIELRSVWL